MQAAELRRSIQRGRSLRSSPGPVIIESGRVEVESSRAESRQADDKQDKQASRQYFKKGVWRVEREGADMCFPYVVHKSCPVCSKCRVGQSWAGSSRKEAGSR